MIVRCVRIFDEMGQEVDLSRGRGHLVIGHEYVALEVYGRFQNWAGLRLIDEQGVPDVQSSGQFELVSGAIPSNWVIHFLGSDRWSPDSGMILLSPASWRGSFWDEYFNRDPRAIEIFDRELAIIRAEA